MIIEEIESGSVYNTRLKHKWYALYTKPRAEKRVKVALETNNIECYLPLLSTPRTWSDRVKIVEIPLFSSYIFIRCKESDIFPLIHINGIVRAIFHNGRPAVIYQKDIDAIKTFLEKAEGKVLCTGDEVEILTGSMKKKSGKIIEIKKKVLLLHIEQLQATVSVRLDCVAPTNRIS